MNENKVTCIQRARFFFYFYEEGEWKRKEKTPMQKFAQLKHAGSDDIRALKDAITWRLERIAQMVEILTNAHADWAITTNKNYVLLETQTLDFNESIKLLKEHGFSEDEFVLRAEYTRAWGMM